jgi:hypothetical protein
VRGVRAGTIACANQPGPFDEAADNGGVAGGMNCGSGGSACSAISRVATPGERSTMLNPSFLRQTDALRSTRPRDAPRRDAAPQRKPVTHRPRKAALAAFFGRLNDDYRTRARRTDYHDDEIKYDYLRLNCAKTIGSAFKLGAGYEDLEVTSAKILSGRPVVAAANANIPTEMAMKLLKAWNARGYGLDVVLYKKYPGSPYVDPHETEKVTFGDLPNRFPSVLSRDFRREQGQYEDVDNLFAMYVLYNLSRYSVRVNDETKLLEIDRRKRPMAYPEAAELAMQSARSDSESFCERVRFWAKGTSIEAEENRQLYGDTGEGAEPTLP